ncbi:apopolysialoglycoprotein [Sarocladium implicatum]|nr:apopolysialoglycoprotein [Sarocladium implicatum]
MAPGTRRANRGGHAEHDDFEGLPVRQWRQEWVSVAPPVQQDIQPKNDIWAHECLYGMPKDIDLLPSHSQALLRAARSGMLYKRPAAPEDEEPEPDAILPEKQEKKEEETEDKGYTIKLWKQIPRNVEANDIGRLAKRRKGTVTISSKTIENKVQGPTVTRATVRRVDAAGNPYTEEVTLTEGQTVQGEIISTRVEPAAATAPELMPHVPPPNRRRPPPPKRKPKAGPGRGKKKQKIPLPGTEAAAAAGTAPDGTASTIPGENGEQGDIKKEGEGTPNQDSEMADDDDDDDDDEEGEEGEDGEEGEGDSEIRTPAAGETSDKPEDTEMTDSAPDTQPQPSEPADVEMKDDDSPPKTTAAPPNPLTLAPPLASLAAGSPKVEGSPLKNVVLPSPTREAPPQLEAQLPLVPTQPDDATVTESLVAEPPSTIVGEEPPSAIEPDIPRATSSTDEALLPPPPDQVGNISSPKSDGPLEKPSDDGPKSDGIQPGEEAIPERPPLVGHDSVMTEDSIKPDDSASAHIVSGAPSEIDAASIAEVPAVPAETKAASPAEEARAVSPAKDAASEGQVDLLGGLMGELDRQASIKPDLSTEQSAEPVPAAAEPASEPAASVEQTPAEPTPVLTPAPQESAAPEVTDAARESEPEAVAVEEPAAAGDTPATAVEPAFEPAAIEPAAIEPPADEAKEQSTPEPAAEATEAPSAEAPVPAESTAAAEEQATESKDEAATAEEKPTE